jgi:hypothetical protein
MGSAGGGGEGRRARQKKGRFRKGTGPMKSLGEDA